MTLLAGGAAFAVVGALLAVRPDRAVPLPQGVAWVAAALAALAFGVSDAAPTGWIVVDVVSRVLLAAAVVLAAARLPMGWTLWLGTGTTAALVLGDAGDWELVGAGGVGVAAALAVSGATHTSALTALAAAASISPLAHLHWPVATGASSLLAAGALVPLLLAAIGVAPPTLRRTLPWALVAVVAVGVAGSVLGALAALGARQDVDRAVDAAVAGLDEADADDKGPALAKLETAAESFEAAESTLRAWWARPALLVPGVAQQSRAVATMADAGAELSRAAADSLAEVDLDTLHPVAGRIDPALIEEVRPPLDRALASLRRAAPRLADVRSPLLLGPVASRLDDLAEKVDDARTTAETASSALAVAPGLLGVDAPQHYFLVMHTPSELRGVGGFMGSWGELVIDDGQIDLVRTGRVSQLTQGGPDPAGRRIEGHPEFVGHWGQAPAQFWGLIGFSPDFPTVSSIITQLYPQSGGTQVDGVIAIDPAAYAALLELTGPVAVAGFDRELTAENAEEILLHEQYVIENYTDREAFLEAATRTLFDKLTSGDLPGPRSISAALAPMVDGRHLQLFSTDRSEQRFFESIDAHGGVTRRAADGIGIVGQNFNGNKIDYFLRRSLTYDVRWDPDTGLVEGALEVRLENLAPSSGLPHAVIGWGGDLSANQLPVADGENLTYLSLYSAAPLDGLAVDGAPAEINRLVPDLGFQAHDLYVRIPSMGTRTVTADVRARVEPGPHYSLEVLRQATATPDQISISVRVPEGWRLVRPRGDVRLDGRVAHLRTDTTTPVRLQLRAEPVERSLLERLQGR